MALVTDADTSKLESGSELESQKDSKNGMAREEEEEAEYTEEDEDDDVVGEYHHLQNKWAIWFYKNDRAKSWTENLKKVVYFGTVEDFWGLINHISPPSKLPSGCDYSLFKDGIEPMWEDKANKNGGSWLITLDKSQRSVLLDAYWMEILMLLIGEAFDEDSDQICGAVVNIRGKGDRLSVWTADCTVASAIMRIGKIIKDALKLNNMSITYQSHDDQQNRTGSKAKSTFQL